MPMTDPIADLLTRIRNANQKAFEKLEVPHSKFKEQIVRILKDEGYLKDYRILRDQGRSVLKISMKYGEREKRVITRLERVSKPSRRIYVGCDEIPRVQGGVGVAILSTPRGVMTDRQARAAGVGGEVVCYVW
jgi:small subunit ribosomal protein S8